MDKFVKGDYNSDHCELLTDGEWFGDVRTDDADEFIKLINGLIEENDDLKKEVKRLKEPNCEKCRYLRRDALGNYCIKKDESFISNTWWAKYCKEYESVLE